MTDDRKKIFVGVFLRDNGQTGEQVATEIEGALGHLDHDVEVNIDRPPRVFSDEELSGRFIDHWVMAQSFIERYEARLGLKLFIDLRLLYLAIISAYDDIERYKLYHLQRPYSDRSDAIKRSAYLTKWITKINPLYAHSGIDEQAVDQIDEERFVDTRVALANIQFALMAATAHMIQFTGEKFVLTLDVDYEISYDLLFRRMNEDALLAIFQMIGTAAKGDDLIIPI